MTFFSRWLNRCPYPVEKSEIEEYHEPKVRQETITKRPFRMFKKYKFSIEYVDGSSQVKYANEYTKVYSEGDCHIELYNLAPIISEITKKFDDNILDGYPQMILKQDEPFIVNFTNVKNIDITELGKYYYVCEEIEYTKTLEKYKEGGDWYVRHVTWDTERDYEIREWTEDGWEAHNE